LSELVGNVCIIIVDITFIIDLIFVLLLHCDEVTDILRGSGISVELLLLHFIVDMIIDIV